MEAEENCVICDCPAGYTTLLSFPPEISSVLKNLQSPQGCDTNTTCEDVERQVQVILLLRKILGLSRKFLQEVLQDSEASPALWGLKMCQSCWKVFEEASFIWGRLHKLHEDFEGVSNLLRVKVIESSGKEQNGVQEESKKTEKKRGRGRPRSKRRCEAGGETGGAVDVSVLRVSQKIRKEFVRCQCQKGITDCNFRLKENSYNKVTQLQGFCWKFNTQISPLSSGPTLKDELAEGRQGCSRADSQDEYSSEMLQQGPRPKRTRVQYPIENQTGLDFSRISDGEIDIEQPVSDPLNDFDDNNCVDDSYSQECDSPESPGDNACEESFQEESDSDFEPEKPESRRKASNRRRFRKRTSLKPETDQELFIQAVKKDDEKYKCSKCLETFESSLLCNEHILHNHYGGIRRQSLKCQICNRCFKRERFLRTHMKMQHPGVNLHSDDMIERSIKERKLAELTYDVIPVGGTFIAKEVKIEAEFSQFTEGETFSFPVVHMSGNIRRVFLPPAFFKLPENVQGLFRESLDGHGCELCAKAFPTKIQLQAHVRKTHEGNDIPYLCPMCPREFISVTHMVLRHVLRSHVPVPGLHCCQECGKKFKESILLQAHIQKQHLGIERPYKCIKCDMRHPSRASLNKHLKRSHKLQVSSYHLYRRKLLKGTAKVPTVKPTVKKRIRRTKKFPCETCSKENQRKIKFATEIDLEVHMKRFHMGISRPYPCTICKKKYSHPSLVEEHMKTHTVRNDLEVEEPEKPDVFVCTPCNKEFTTRTGLNSHLQSKPHEDIRPFVCEICSQSFRDMRNLENHQKHKHHQELNIQPYECKFCHKILGSARTLDDHIKILHTKDAKYSCPHCDTLFQFESALQTHINVRHTKSRQFLCPQCPKMFSHPYYLSNHMRIHTGEKPFECKICLKKFADKSTCNRHVEAHSNIVHNCPHCHKTGFKTRHALGVHMKTHKGLKRTVEGEFNTGSDSNKSNHEVLVNQSLKSPDMPTSSQPILTADSVSVSIDDENSFL